jgi:hypothetical protein
MEEALRAGTRSKISMSLETSSVSLSAMG